MKRTLRITLPGTIMLAGLAYYNSAYASDLETLQNNLNTVWTCLAAFMVFAMQAGFALVEMGLTRSKNSINIIMKNLMDFSFGSLLFFFVGYGLMFGTTNRFFGTTDFMLSGVSGDYWSYTFVLFQTVFAATAATIVSSAMAERTIFTSYLLYSVVITGLIYPISGSWAWGSLANGSGWLENLSTGAFIDFAGSTTLGDGSIGRIAFITNISAVGGAVTAMALFWWKFGKPDVTMSLNGALAGLVGITAGCANVAWQGSLIIGIVSGILVTYSVLFIDTKLKIDDPVGAISVHGICGAWGTLAVGLFGAELHLGVGETNTGLFYGGGFNQLISQATGVFSFMAWALLTGFILFWSIKKFYGLRVSADEEYVGLDIEEHGLEAYYESK